MSILNHQPPYPKLPPMTEEQREAVKQHEKRRLELVAEVLRDWELKKAQPKTSKTKRR